MNKGMMNSVSPMAPFSCQLPKLLCLALDLEGNYLKKECAVTEARFVEEYTKTSCPTTLVFVQIVNTSSIYAQYDVQYKGIFLRI